MALDTSQPIDARCVCKHGIAVHGIKNDPGCAFCGCPRFRRPAVSEQAAVPLGKFPSSAFDLLRKSSDWQAMAPAALTAFVKDGHGRMFAPQTFLVSRGEKSHALHVLLSGTALIEKDVTGQGNVVGPGDVAGDVRAFTDEPRWASIIALESALALEVDTASLHSTFAQHPEFFMALVCSVGKFSDNPEEVIHATVQVALERYTAETKQDWHEGLDPAKKMEIAARWGRIKEQQRADDRAQKAARAAIDSQTGSH